MLHVPVQLLVVNTHSPEIAGKPGIYLSEQRILLKFSFHGLLLDWKLPWYTLVQWHDIIALHADLQFYLLAPLDCIAPERLHVAIVQNPPLTHHEISCHFT